MDNLFRRHIVQSGCCNICKAHPEDILHVVWGCIEVASMWSTLSWAHQSASPPPGDFTNLFSRLLQAHEDYRVEIFAITAWLLWNHRNAIRLEHSTRPLNQVFAVAAGMLQDFLNCQDKDPVIAQVPNQLHWSPPDQNQYKANFDGVVSSAQTRRAWVSSFATTKVLSLVH